MFNANLARRVLNGVEIDVRDDGNGGIMLEFVVIALITPMILV